MVFFAPPVFKDKKKYVSLAFPIGFIVLTTGLYCYLYAYRVNS
jgi:hypothetical protein